jgi:hypothetical protein
MLLLILDQFKFDRQICSFAGDTLLNRHLGELSIHELEMIFRVTDTTVQTRAADAIMLTARSKDDLGQLVVSPNVHQYSAAQRTLSDNPSLTDVYRCMAVAGVAEAAYALFQQHILAGDVSWEHLDHFCQFNQQFGPRLLVWISTKDVARRIPTQVPDTRDTGYQPSPQSRLRWRFIREKLSCYELARAMSEPTIAEAAFREYKARIRAGTIPPEHVYGMCHPSRPFARELREWLIRERIEYDLPHSTKLLLWAMMKTSSPAYAHIYVH